MSAGKANRTVEANAKQLVVNLKAVLQVAGQRTDEDLVRPVRLTQLKEHTGVARSTVSALLSESKESQVNPDLSTLSKLSEVLGIPLGFLLMGPQEWEAIAKAAINIEDFFKVAEKLSKDRDPSRLVEATLAELDLLIEKPPIGAKSYGYEKEKLENRNRWRKRSCSAFSELVKAHQKNGIEQLYLTALAASYIQQTVPTNPDWKKL